MIRTVVAQSLCFLEHFWYIKGREIILNALLNLKNWVLPVVPVLFGESELFEAPSSAPMRWSMNQSGLKQRSKVYDATFWFVLGWFDSSFSAQWLSSSSPAMTPLNTTFPKMKMGRTDMQFSLEPKLIHQSKEVTPSFRALKQNCGFMTKIQLLTIVLVSTPN